ncbi:hypothetical protein NB636_07305 [Oxalobacter aliiformigenes]|uniref:hypothetical protein n=1 Tax=Oxalobacter aliiformigenes TaxID=2946593 RepID=UPI0022B0319D|nr:hypothetical protein [Oxalobacter aliiformigenes]MCZ4063904.1 hypothetical protein [Oxalobacter aliiformigenes]WAV98526.1 hypothetical protein NB636_07305 [Oxalobacter aliiformigenes]
MFREVNEEFGKRRQETEQKIEKILGKYFLDAHIVAKGCIPYITIIPHKYARYYTFFTPHPVPQYSAAGKRKLRQIQRTSKKLCDLIAGQNKLPPREFCMLNKEFNFRFGLGIYACATLDLENAASEILRNVELPKGRKENHYYGLVKEMAKDFELITGEKPSLSKDPITNKPTGTFYRFVSDMFDVLGFSGKACIEAAVKKCMQPAKSKD